MPTAAELLLLGGFGAPSSDKIAVLHHFTVSRWVGGSLGGVTLVLSEVPRQGPIDLFVCFLSFKKWAVLLYFPNSVLMYWPLKPDCIT